MNSVVILAILCLALIFIPAVILIIVQFVKDNKDINNGEFDERQIVSRRLAGNIAFVFLFIWCVLLLLASIIKDYESLNFAIPYKYILLFGIIASLIIYTQICIWTDSYFKGYGEKKAVTAPLILVSVFSIAYIIRNIRAGDVFGAVTIGVAGLFAFSTYLSIKIKQRISDELELQKAENAE